ncbi:uncharacterized protein CC84DRAFT_801482 [Paraphaeosphaeria sporulosa]|uniref:Uncharacterized protein n=1 Tax=Paraphaeosphaeria sporulosa TaxID=1460663 RepID=A0A177CD50_9PLEO|nr:uncharacterized protein CC84DRAFT_801482 [Paraphaeosphaeria sporulosa]OAG04739.1 hypothetical protein CC84DRAFT_801482 [Paraphaeosphaeria sporulosa]
MSTKSLQFASEVVSEAQRDREHSLRTFQVRRPTNFCRLSIAFAAEAALPFMPRLDISWRQCAKRNTFPVLSGVARSAMRSTRSSVRGVRETTSSGAGRKAADMSCPRCWRFEKIIPYKDRLSKGAVGDDDEYNLGGFCCIMVTIHPDLDANT